MGITLGFRITWDSYLWEHMILKLCERLTGNWFWNHKERVQKQLRYQDVGECKCLRIIIENKEIWFVFLCIVYFHISHMVYWFLPRRRKAVWCGKILTSDYKSLCTIKKSSCVAIQSE